MPHIPTHTSDATPAAPVDPLAFAFAPFPRALETPSAPPPSPTVKRSPIGLAGSLALRAAPFVFKQLFQNLKKQGKNPNDPATKNELFAKAKLLQGRGGGIPSTAGQTGGEPSMAATGAAPGAPVIAGQGAAGVARETQPEIFTGLDAAGRARSRIETSEFFEGRIQESQQRRNDAFVDFQKAAAFDEDAFIKNLKGKIQGTSDIDAEISELQAKLFTQRPELLTKFEDILDPNVKESLIRMETQRTQNEIINLTKLKVDREGTISQIIESAKSEKRAEIDSLKLGFELAKQEFQDEVKKSERGLKNFDAVVKASDTVLKLRESLSSSEGAFAEISGTITPIQRTDRVAEGDRWLDRSVMRTDRHNNPTAIKAYPQFLNTLKNAGLQEGVDFWVGDDTLGIDSDSVATVAFKDIDTGIRGNVAVIDQIGFFTSGGQQRWNHTAIDPAQWNTFSDEQKASTIAQMYQREGGKGDFASLQPPRALDQREEEGSIFDRIVFCNLSLFCFFRNDAAQEKADRATITVLATSAGGSKDERAELLRQFMALYTQENFTVEQIKEIANAKKTKPKTFLERAQERAGGTPTAGAPAATGATGAVATGEDEFSEFDDFIVGN